MGICASFVLACMICQQQLQKYFENVKSCKRIQQNVVAAISIP